MPQYDNKAKYFLYIKNTDAIIQRSIYFSVDYCEFLTTSIARENK